MAIFKTLIYAAMFALCVGICYLIVFVTNKLPGQHGVIHVSRSSGNGTIYRMLDGIPHVHADSLNMGGYSLGFAMTSDRVFQMDKLRRLAQGRLSEIFGQKAVPVDMAIRNLGLKHLAKKIFDGLDQEAQALFINFADGVNDYLEFFSVGIDYWLIGAEFERWIPEDSISIYLFTVYLLTEGHKDELLSEYFYSKLQDKTLIDQIFTIKQENELDICTPIITDDELKEFGLFQDKSGDKNIKADTNSKFFDFIENNIDEELKVVREIFSFYSSQEGASNCWAVHGNYTKSGKPILVNDPHLDPSLPSPVYMAELNIKDNYIIGALLPGMPVFISFRTNNISVGVTSLNADIIDLFEETINGTSYLFKGKWEPLIIQEELIKVKDVAEPIKMIVRHTHHGPVLDYFGAAYYLSDTSYPPLKPKADISFSWVPALTTKNSLLNTMTKVFSIKTVHELVSTIKGRTDSNFGLCLADSSNNIGWIAATGYPIRTQGQISSLHIKDGASGMHEWKGLVPPEDIPHMINPSKGYVFSTNGRVSSINTKYGIGSHQSSNGRSVRINRLLHSMIHVDKKKVDAEDMKTCLGDVFDVYAELKVPLLIQIIEKNYLLDSYITDRNALKQIKIWIDDLKKWNYRFEYDLKEPTIFTIWEFYIVDNLFKKQIPNSELRRFPSKIYGYEDFMVKLLENLNQNSTYFSEFCENSESPQRTCDKMIADGLLYAYKYLKEKGSDLSNESLKYKNWHKVEYPYVPFTKTFLRIFFDKSDFDNGSKNTLNVGSVFYSDFERSGLNTKHTPVYRMIIDFGKDKDCQFSIDTGVSENLLGNYFYFNQHEAHTSLKMLPMTFNSINTTQTQRFGTLRLIYKDWFHEEEQRLLQLEKGGNKTEEFKDKKEDL